MSAALDLDQLEKLLRAPCYRVEKFRGGRRVTFIGEHTSRNTAADALQALAELARRAGLDAGLEVSGRGPLVWINPIDPPPDPEEPTNDIGHQFSCGCPECMPEDYDPAELEAGLSEKGRI